MIGGKKLRAKIGQFGRSMVEMLGVLAIIGVLSVGAIAGYSKAMFKYRLIKQAQQLNQVINTVAVNARNFNDLSSTERMPIIPYLIKLGEIPAEMVKNSKETAIYDVFNSFLVAYMQPAGISKEHIPNVTSLFIRLNFTKNNVQDKEVCLNTFNVIKENSGNIYYVYSTSRDQTDTPTTSRLYGDQYCTQNNKCLKNLDIQSMEKECSLHIANKNNIASIVILWKL